MGGTKAIFLKIHYFHGLKKFHTISEGPKIFRLDFCGKWPYEFLKLYEEIWPKFEQVSKKVPTPRTLGVLAFDEYSTFDRFALFGGIKRGRDFLPLIGIV